MKTNFENIGGSYSQQGDYLLPNLTLLDENQRQISVWAMRHRRYLKSSHRVLYYNLLTSGKLYNYLADVELQAENVIKISISGFSFNFVFEFIRFCLSLQPLWRSLPFPYISYRKVRQSVSLCIRLRQASNFQVLHLEIQNITFCLRARSRQPCRKNGLKHYEQSRKYCANKAENR